MTDFPLDPRTAMLVAKLRQQRVKPPAAMTRLPDPQVASVPQTRESSSQVTQFPRAAQAMRTPQGMPVATSPEVTQLVASLPPEQRAQYTAFAASQGVTLEQLIERLLAQQQQSPGAPNVGPTNAGAPPDFYSQT